MYFCRQFIVLVPTVVVICDHKNMSCILVEIFSRKTRNHVILNIHHYYVSFITLSIANTVKRDDDD